MMTGKKALFAIIAVCLLMSGCASRRSGSSLTDSWWKCATAGGILGGAGGALDNSNSAGYGAFAGAILGGVICAVVGDEEGESPTVETSPLPDCEFIIPGWDVAVNGCPEDIDQDGVPDPLDQCPRTSLGAIVDERGCVVVVTEQEEVDLEPVHFKLSSFDLTTKARSILDDQISVIQQYPTSRVVVSGYTDTTGPLSFNNKLSRQRAVSVRSYLINQGIDSSRIDLHASGPEEPIASNDTRPGREMNRRVQILLKPQDVSYPY